METLFRDVKSVLETRPIYHQRDDTIRGHVFSSFLALVLLNELRQRMEARGFNYEWDHLRKNLKDLEEVRAEAVDRQIIMRTIPKGDAGRALQAVGVALGPALRFEELEAKEG